MWGAWRWQGGWAASGCGIISWAVSERGGCARGLDEAVQRALARLEDEAEPAVGKALCRAEADDVRVLDAAEHARLQLERPLHTPPLTRLGTRGGGGVHLAANRGHP